MKKAVIMSVLFLTGCSETFVVTKGEGGAPGNSGGVGNETSTGGSVLGTGGNSVGGSSGSSMNAGGTVVGTGGNQQSDCLEPSSKCVLDPSTYKCGYEKISIASTWNPPTTQMPLNSFFESSAKTLAESSDSCGGGCFISGSVSGWCPDSSYNMILDCPLNNGSSAPILEETLIHTINNCVLVASSGSLGSAWCCVATAK